MKDNAYMFMQIVWGGGGGGGGKQGVLYSNIISLFFMFVGIKRAKDVLHRNVSVSSLNVFT